MRDNGSLKHPSTGLSGTQFATLNSAGINDPEGPEKYNMLWSIKIWKQSDPSDALITQNYMKVAD
jgi:hypothetical protein